MRVQSIGLCVALAAGAASAAEEPDWLKQARAREGELGRARKLKVPDGWFSARVPAKLDGKVEKDEDGDYTFRFDIGAASPVECLVLHESVDPPAFLRATSSGTLDFLAERNGAIEVKEVESVDAGAIGGAIFMSADWLYVANGAAGKAVGSAHMAYAVKHDAGIYCAKTEIGYTQTFRALFNGLVESFERSEPPPPASFTEIIVASVAGKRIGVGIGTIRRDDDGDKREEQTLHMLLPATSDSLNANTSVDLEWVDGDDLSLLNAVTVESDNGEITTQLTLNWSAEKERWLVAGKLEGKPFDAELAEGSAPSTNLAAAAALRKALAVADPKGGVVTTWEWIDSSPGQLIEAKTTIDELLDGARAKTTQTLGPIRMQAIIDRASGLMLSGTMNMGSATLTIERVYVDGAP